MSFYRALKALGKQVELEIYPGAATSSTSPIWSASRCSNLEWFKKWLAPTPAQITQAKD